MPAVELNLFVDLTNRRLVTSLTDSSQFSLPQFWQEDKVAMTLTIMRASVGNPYAPFAKITPHSGLSMVCKIVTLLGVVLASGTSSYDSATDTLALTLDLNTANMVTAMSGQTTISPVIEFELDDGTNKLTAFQTTIQVLKEYITSASVSPNPLETFLTEAQSNGRFVRKLGQPGEAITLTSPDGSKQVVLYVDDAGAFHADAI